MNDTKYWIALDQVKGMGPAHLQEVWKALDAKGLSLADLYDCTAAEIREELSLPDRTAESVAAMKTILPKIEDDYLAVLDAGMDAVTFFSPHYPLRLMKTLGNSFPPILYVLGNKDILAAQGVAVLGDRDVSERGEIISFGAARELAKHGLSVISGYAKGADMIAHRSALIHGGATAALVPYGILHFAPAKLISDVFDPGRMAVISPFPPRQEANQYNAFIRNKIACAMARAVFIVEAPPEGGIFEAAKSARNIGVPLFTTEYHEYPKNAGGNALILTTMGARPVRGRYENEMLVPNMDDIIGTARFKETP